MAGSPATTNLASSSSGSNSPLRPMSSFQPASSLPRDTNASTSGTSGGGGLVQPRPRPLIRGAAGTGNTILVNNCQRGNPLLSHIRNVGWEYADIVPDYQVGLSSCVLFLSIRYHRLHPEYVHTRIAKLAQMYTLRILLVLCDVNDHAAAIKELTKTALINNLTLMVAWSAEEAARYVETYKSFEFKPPDLIQERIGDDYLSQVTNVLTQVRGVNKTDVVTLLSRFGSVKGVVSAEVDQVGMCPGFGEVKAKRLKEVVSMPFRVGEGRTWKQRRLDRAAGTTTTTADSAGATERRGGAQLQDALLASTAASSSPSSTTAAAGSTSTTTTTNPPPLPSAPAAPPPQRALDVLELDQHHHHDDDDDDDDDDDEEEAQLRLAMQLSMAQDVDAE